MKINSDASFRAWIAKQIQKDDSLLFDDILEIIKRTKGEETQGDYDLSTCLKRNAKEFNDYYSFQKDLVEFQFKDTKNVPQTWSALLLNEGAMQEIYEYICGEIFEADCDRNNEKGEKLCPFFVECDNWYGNDEELPHLERCMSILKGKGYIQVYS